MTTNIISCKVGGIKTEKKVLEAVNEKEVIQLTSDIVRIPSYSRKEGELANFLAKKMEDMGLEVELQDIKEYGAPNVIGRLTGSGEGLSLMFNGHMDHNPVVEGWTEDPFGAKIKNGCIYGVGVNNMKAGVASMLMAIDAIHKAEVELKGDIIFAGVVGELQGGTGTINLINKGIKTDMAIVAEPSSLNISTVHPGVVNLKITTLGKSVHMNVMSQGVNAILKMCRVIEDLKEIKFIYEKEPHKYVGLPLMNIGTIKGGITREYHDWRPSILPDVCTIVVDVRYVPSQTHETVVKDIENVLNKLKAKDPELKTEIEILGPPKFGSIPPYEISPDEYIVKAVRRAHRYVFGKEPYVGDLSPIVGRPLGGTDASRLMKAGIKAVWYGPGKLERGGKYPDARVEVSDIVNATKVYALTALDVCTKTRD